MITIDSYQIFIDKIRNTTDNISFGGTNVTATTNTLFTNVLPQVTYQELSGTCNRRNEDYFELIIKF